MNIAELFVNLGIKGSDQTVGALTSVKKGLGEVSSMSLEAKAGILAAMYGLERMMAVSGQAGTNLTNFASLTGISAKTLQEWQYAARQAGVSGEELSGSMKAVQNSMSNMLLGKGAPEGMKVVANAVGGIDINRVRDVTYMMGKLQEAAQKLPKDIGNNVLKSFGISEGTIAAMRRNAFNPAAFAKAPTYSDKEVNQLDKSNIAWSNLGNKIQMAMGHLNAKHGLALVNDISLLTDKVFLLIGAFEKLAEKMKLISLIGKSFEGWGMILTGVTNAVGDVQKDKNGIGSGLANKLGDIIQGTAEAAHGAYLTAKEAIAPPTPAFHGSGNTTHSTTFHQNITHHGDAKDTKAVKDAHKTAINHAFRQRSAQGQGS